MSNSNDFPSEIQKHFYSLPPMIQETILQSGVQVQSVEQLDSLAKDLAKANKKVGSDTFSAEQKEKC